MSHGKCRRSKFLGLDALGVKALPGDVEPGVGVSLVDVEGDVIPHSVGRKNGVGMWMRGPDSGDKLVEMCISADG